MTPQANYWHLWTDDQGISHQTQCEFKGFVTEVFAPPSPPTHIDRLKVTPTSMVVGVLEPGKVSHWHKNPKPQWIIPLSGRWYVESMDGTRVEMGPGEISFGEDHTSEPDAQGRIGHLSGAVGDEPAVLLVVQIEDDPAAGGQCRF
ncbi:cupin domain-containing protein [Roseibium sp. RKSG952]|uniref:cupin domain-containing protein n=1 Tax=Roseibium sp. RKSG952 TaxID=2529384 RepID=UPI0012BD5321|nr:cupin domain-containing protein [Roseibium sp. RKSG952]MTH99561.1 cupin domain-containing protein [Roseibium sp. RKSG952]